MTTPAAVRYYASGGPFQSARASSYRYLTTSILSGVLMGDWLPVEPQSFSMVINGGGTISASLDLIPASPQQNLVNLQAITPRKSVLWVLQDNVPIWNGILWDWVPTTILQQQLPFQGATMESILSRRIINTDLVFTDTDVFDMARAICQFAFSQSPNGQVAGITYPAAESGITDTVTFDGSQNQDCLAALGTLVNTYGIEFSFRPYMDQAGNLRTSVDLGYPALGQPYPQSGLAYSFPGNLLDYEFTATGSTCANSLIATAQSPGDTGESLTGTALDTTDIGNGYPLLEQAISATGVNFTTDSQLDSYAAGVLPSVTATQLAPLVVLGNGQQPALNVTQLGSYASVAFTSALHPAGTAGIPGFTGIGRIVSWACYPPTSQQAEYADIQLGDMPFEGSVLVGAQTPLTGATGGGPGGGGPAGASLSVTTTTLPDAAENVAYSVPLAASGGTGIGYTWALSSGSLPSWATLDASGVISGTPDTAGTTDFAVDVTDSAGNVAIGPLSITVGSSSLVITTMSLPDATEGTAYSVTLEATGGS